MINKVNYPVGDFLIRIKNAAMSKRHGVSVSATKFIEQVAKVLVAEGFLQGVEKKDGILTVRLTYLKKEPVLIDLKLVSKPGLRVYKSVQELEEKKGAAVLIVSTNKGVMSDKKAVKERLGGEVIAEVD